MILALLAFACSGNGQGNGTSSDDTGIGDDTGDSIFTPGSEESVGCSESKYETVQDAFDNATDGEIIKVCAGTYNGGFSLSSKSLSLQGEGTVVFDGNNTEQIMTVNGDADLSVDGIDFQNGNAENGGAFNIDGAEVNLSNAEVSSNNATNGGAFYLTNEAYLSIDDVSITNNAADTLGGAFYADGGSHIADVTSTFTEISGNASSFRGGLAYLDGSFFYQYKSSGNVSYVDNSGEGAVYLGIAAEFSLNSAEMSNHQDAECAIDLEGIDSFAAISSAAEMENNINDVCIDGMTYDFTGESDLYCEYNTGLCD